MTGYATLNNNSPEAEQLAHLGSWERELFEDRVWWSGELYRIFGLAPDQSPPTVAAHAIVIDRQRPLLDDDLLGLAAALTQRAGVLERGSDASQRTARAGTRARRCPAPPL